MGFVLFNSGACPQVRGEDFLRSILAPDLPGCGGLEKGESPPQPPAPRSLRSRGARAEGEKMGNGCRAGADIVEERMKKGKNYEEIEETI